LDFESKIWLAPVKAVPSSSVLFAPTLSTRAPIAGCAMANTRKFKPAAREMAALVVEKAFWRGSRRTPKEFIRPDVRSLITNAARTMTQP